MRRLCALVKNRLASRWTPWVAAGLAMLLTLPSLNVGWELDDYYHRLVLGMQYPINGDTLTVDIFRFGSGSADDTRLLMDYGSLPWWTAADWKAGFWRPLAAVTQWVDYRLWPAAPRLMHLHSVLWFGFLVVLVGRLYHRMVAGAWIAGLATLLFAIDDAHAAAVGWLANRNEIIAMVLGVAALLSHHRWRSGQARWGAALGPLLYAAALLAKESAIAVTAYLFAYAVFIDRAHARQRVLTLLPYALITVAWRAVWDYLGYGVAGMDLYTDPLAEPLRFASLAVIRIPTLLLGQWGIPPSDVTLFWSAGAQRLLAAFAVVALALLAALLAPLFRRDREARFWALGMILAVLPGAATFPSDRLLYFVGLGAMALLARFIGWVCEANPGAPVSARRSAWQRRAAMILVVIHLFVPLAFTPLRAYQPFGSAEASRRLYYTPADAGVETQDAVLVNAPSILHTCMSWARQATNGQSFPRRFRVLSTGLGAVHVYRPDERTVVLRPENGFLTGLFDMLFRSSSQPLRPGETIALTGFKAEVLAATDHGRPLEVKFSFSVPLESPELRWMYFAEDGFRPFTLPDVGKSVNIPGVSSLF